MRIHAFADTHNHGPKWDGTTIKQMIELSVEKKKLGEETYLLGDIIDARRCLKTDVDAMRRDFFKLSEHFKNNYIKGNHETSLVNNFVWKYWRVIEYKKHHYLILTHLHRCEYSQDKIFKWENYPLKGISHKMWIALKLGYEAKKLVHKNKSHLSKSQVTSYLEHIKMNDAHVTLVGGHKHPHKMIDETYFIESRNTEVRIVVCPVGYSTIEV